MKKILTFLLLILMTVVITGCSSEEYIPTAIITNIDYDSTTETFGFQVEVTDKSNTVENVVIQLHSQEETKTIKYTQYNSLYSFSNVKTDEEYSIKILATYQMNETLLEDKEIYSIDITSFISTKATYFSSRTFTYTGDVYSIYLSNIDSMYTVKYTNNAQSEIGIHEVTASVYLDDELLQTYVAYIVITEDAPELNVEDQSHYYTGNEIEVDYIISNTATTNITYNGSTQAPTEVGEYVVVIEVAVEGRSSLLRKQITMKIIKSEIEIYTSNIVLLESVQQEIEVKTNIECEYTITFNNKTTQPTTPGVYEVIITVEETKNHYSSIKHLTLTILEEDSIEVAHELFISQVVYTSDYDVIVELYNPTQSKVDLSDYKLMIGDISHNKFITLSGEIDSLSTYSIASTTTSHTDITFNHQTSYLVVSSYDNISLYNDGVLDEISLGNSINYIRKSEVGFPNETFDESEWLYYENDVNITINTHEYNYSATNTSALYEVSYKKVNYINYKDEVNFNDYISITLSNNLIDVTSNMIISNNINTNIIGTYSVTFRIGDYEFTTSFVVTDLEGPIITVNNVSLIFNIDDTIDYLSLVSVEDINEYTVEYSVNTLVLGANAVTYTATDSHGNVTQKTIYIHIK